MCSIMGYCDVCTDIAAFTDGFMETVSRGPDDSRIVDTGHGLLGFHRLAIMGLTPEGMQPFKMDGSYVVCNGEIYGYEKCKAKLLEKGYSFRSGSDCEILLPLYKEYGVEMFKMLDAEYALILFDGQTKQFIAARDPIGIRPLYYGYDKKGVIAFASEPKDKDAYSIRHCFDTHQIFVAAPNYDCDFDHAHTLEEIAAFPLILLERKASSRAYVEQYFQQHGVSLKPEIELGSHNLLISLARIGLGVACVTEEFSQSGLGRGVILPVRTAFEIPPRSVCMCTLRDVSPTSAANRFMDFISESDKMTYDIGHSYHFTNV